MELYQRKLPKEAVSTLFRVKVTSVKPFTPLLGPCYVFLKKNDKFIAVKKPLDFFSEKELTQNESFEFFYFPKTIQNLVLFQEAGRRVRAVLLRSDEELKSLSIDPSIAPNAEAQRKLPPTPFSVSDSIVRKIGPLFAGGPRNKETGISLLSIVAFVNELCDFEGHSEWVAAREKSTDLYEQSLFLSSWSVFCALLLDYHDLNFLSRLRIRVFNDVIGERISKSAAPVMGANEVEELVLFSLASVSENPNQVIPVRYLERRTERVAKKLADRMHEVVRARREVVSLVARVLRMRRAEE